jgi:preprotein translocase subunit SecA
MFSYIARQLFGTQNDRVLKGLRPIVVKINESESNFAKMSDDELKAFGTSLREKVANGAPLDLVKIDSFALVRETARRVLGMRHFDVQLIGGLVLHSGSIAEMKTGEGKTLMSTLPAYLNALEGRGVHIVTVNDYLARRDAEWMGQIYRFLGLSVGVIHHGVDESTRQEAYNADITYGQNNEFGFDFLRDNMKFSLDELVQRDHRYAIVDEVDSILIDEARTPLIISGPAEDSTKLYLEINTIIPHLNDGVDFEMDLKSKNPILTDQGVLKTERLLEIDNLYDPGNIDVLHHVNQALRAHRTMYRDQDYVVRDGQVIIVDEFTGRLMPGRRWSRGLHQAVEAKEGVRVQRESQTLASITFQNYFRMYDKLSGMTGTADTEATEFSKIYNLNVVVIPTNKPLIRHDLSDLVYRTKKEKYAGIVDAIIEVHKTGQPILVGTVSIEQSEMLSRLLIEKETEHNVLNAKHHEREAEIVAQAGRLGAVTISTNMAGRGTDILLGGNPEFLAYAKTKSKDWSLPENREILDECKKLCAEEREKVIESGGLYILGTERHESRRIDNQLRGRAGRQGDPGTSRFHVSLEDDLMVRFAGERVQQLMSLIGWEEGLALDSKMISRRIEEAQKRVEGIHFESRKYVTDYDDVMNRQRQVVYNERLKYFQSEDLTDEIYEMIDDVLEDLVLSCNGVDKGGLEKSAGFDTEKYQNGFIDIFGVELEKQENDNQHNDVQKRFDYARERAKSLYKNRRLELNEKLEKLKLVASEHSQNEQSGNSFSFDEEFADLASIERRIMLEVLDHTWNHHLYLMDELREGIGLRGYGQKNPLHEYQTEAFTLFQQSLAHYRLNVLKRIFHLEIIDAESLIASLEMEKQRREELEKALEINIAQYEEEDNSAQIEDLVEQQRRKLSQQRKERRRHKVK